MNFTSLRHALVASLALSVGCDGGGDDPKDTETDTETPTCVSGISYTFPEQSATGVFYRTPIEVAFNQVESATTADITLTDGAGAEVLGAVSFSTDGKVATFKPAADLMASTTYTLNVSYTCEKVAAISFTTSDTGPAVDAATLIDNVYNVDFLSGRITEPPGVGDLLTGLLAGGDPIYILISPSLVVGTQITMTGALGATDVGGGIIQDVCTESIDFPVPADYTGNPFFDISGNDVSISVEGFDLSIATLNVTGAFSPDGERIEGVAISAFADVSGLSELTEGVDVCVFLAGLGLGVNCQDCDNDPATTDDVNCLKLTIDSMVGAKIDGLIGLDLITAEAVAANPECATE